jgi:hypothetical protein
VHDEMSSSAHQFEDWMSLGHASEGKSGLITKCDESEMIRPRRSRESVGRVESDGCRTNYRGLLND